MRGLPGKTAVVTGGAQGLGEAIARRLSEEGCLVAIFDIHAAGEESARRIERQTGRPVLFYPTNIADLCSVRDSVQKLTDRLEGGPVHILVNNAAVFVFKGVEAEAEDWDRILNVNVKGTSQVTQALLPLLEQAGGASIVNLSSVSGFVGQSKFSTYNATKFAIRGLTKCWALDLAGKKIRVNTVCPGYIYTDAFEQSCRDLEMDIAEENARVSLLHMLGRQGRPDEVAGAVAFLASEDSSFVTGSDLIVDGGYLAM